MLDGSAAPDRRWRRKVVVSLTSAPADALVAVGAPAPYGTLEPVTSGQRVVLVYDLLRRGKASPRVPDNSPTIAAGRGALDPRSAVSSVAELLARAWPEGCVAEDAGPITEVLVVGGEAGERLWLDLLERSLRDRERLRRA